jgi:hypothetical protein
MGSIGALVVVFIFIYMSLSLFSAGYAARGIMMVGVAAISLSIGLFAGWPKYGLLPPMHIAGIKVSSLLTHGGLLVYIVGGILVYFGL